MIITLLIYQCHLNFKFVNGRKLKELGYPLEGTGKNIHHLKIRAAENLIHKSYLI
ncbi:MAG: hypothetical protein Q8N08_06980 [Methanobacteriaceae archaeon]|nr:hypothetical protein [Methanobacteriaceae archaeon]